MEEKMTFEQANKLLSYCVGELDAYKGQITDIHKRIVEQRGEEDV